MKSLFERWGATEIPARVAERAATRYRIEGECFVSTYSTMSTGYAQVGGQDANGRIVTLAHRAAWTYHFGRIPPGVTVDHLCKNKTCVRREHLRLLSNLENARRTSGRDWPLGGCINGHPASEWSPKIAGVRQKGYCKPCKADVQRRHREVRKGDTR